MENVKKNYSEKIEKTLAVLKEDLNTVRAGRANPAILDKISAEYYGVPTPLKSLANISVPDPRTLMISPFDASSVSAIEKAINEANLGLNPSNDGKVIRLIIPHLTEEPVSYTHLFSSFVIPPEIFSVIDSRVLHIDGILRTAAEILSCRSAGTGSGQLRIVEEDVYKRQVLLPYVPVLLPEAPWRWRRYQDRLHFPRGNR